MSHGPSSNETRHLRTLFAVGAAGMLTDGQLLKRFASRSGDPAELAFAALVERHGSMVLRVARAILRDEHSAHDAFQATFLILARKARSLWVRDSLGPWLHSVAFRVASQSRSLENRQKRREQATARTEATPSHDPDRADLIRAIHEEIDRLPQPFRLAIVTCHLEGLTQHDAAQRLGWPVGTLQSRLARGRQKLRDRLERRGLNPSLGVIAYQFSPVPPLLTTTTAKLAASLQLGRIATGMIAPTVLALIETSTKGMLMTKLKLGAAAIVMMVGGAVGSGYAVGVGRPVQATDGTPTVVVPADEPTASKKTSKGKLAPSLAEPTADPDGIPAPAEGLGFPVLLDFYTKAIGPANEMRPVVARLAEAGYPVKSIDYDRSSDLAARYKVSAVPTFILVDGSGNELNRLKGQVSAQDLANFYNNNRPKPSEPESAVEEPDAVSTLDPVPQKPDELEPALTDPTAPKPWATVVRIKMLISEKEWGFASGTVISSTPEESIILTCGHCFRTKDQTQPAPRDYKIPITVDLFNGQLVGNSPARVGQAEQDIVGEAIDYDFDNDVGLIRIRPGRVLPVSRVVPASWRPGKGMKMITVGCSHGADATAWDTTILDPRVAMTNSATKSPFFEIKCKNQPKEGRAGGGLYTTDGLVAGVCNFADPNEHVGLYAVPEAIHRILDRNGMRSLYDPTEETIPPTRTEDVDVHGFKYPAPADMLASAGQQSSNPAIVGQPPQRPVQPKAKPEGPKQVASEPSLTDPTLPKPWETVVRVNILKGKPSAQTATGVVVQSWPTTAFVLTSARSLRETGIGVSRDTRSRLFATPRISNISVDLFDGKVVGRSPGQVSCIERDLPAEVIACNFAADLAVLKIQTNRQLVVSPLVKPGSKAVEGVEMISVGCSDGNDATAWNTTVLDPHIPLTAKDGSTVVMKCEHLPRPGRSGGGLFTLDGSLAGICTYADPAAQSGFYATPQVIRKFLYDQGLRDLSGPEDPEPSKPKAENSNPFLDSPLYKPTPEDRRVSGQHLDPVLGVLEEKADGTIVPFSLRQYKDMVANVDESPPGRQMLPRVRSDDQRRIDELEKKLDQVLKALEGLKGEKTPE